jgi:hypothetical protein
MDTGMIGKIEKSKLYAQERERIRFDNFRVVLNGKHGLHVVEYVEGAWTCDCDFFQTRGVCSHTMALERILTGMLAEALPLT